MITERHIITRGHIRPTQYYVKNALTHPEWNTDPGRANLFTSEKIAQAIIDILKEHHRYHNLIIHEATLTIHDIQ